MLFARAVACAFLLAAVCCGGEAALAQSDDVRTAQRRLTELGYQPGAIDGMMGARTRTAISNFQRQSGLPATGELDARTLRALVPPSPPPAAATRSPPPPTPTRTTSTSSDSSSGWLWWVAGAGVVLWLFSRRKKRRSKSMQSVPASTFETSPPETIRNPRRAYIPETPRRTVAVQNGNQFWIDADGNAEVAGHQIGGMVYVGRGLDSSFGTPENCLIDPGLPVAQRGPDIGASQMPYWPSYAAISSSSRLAYLNWLETGRSNSSYGVGYVFLFFYGIERRLILDNPPPGERAALVAELHRLRGIYAKNRSFDRYSRQLLETMALLDAKDFTAEPVFESSGVELPLPVRVGIGKKLVAGEPIDGLWLLSWWSTHPQARRRTPAQRAAGEFRQLFKLRFDKRYPEGLKISAPKRSLVHVYRAASGSFERTFKDELAWCPDISQLTKPVSIAAEIAESCMDDLDAYSRFLGRNPEGRDTLEAYALLPDDLARTISSAELDGLKAWIAERIAQDGGMIAAESLLERLQGKRPERIARRQLIAAAESLCRLSFGLAPDPHCAIRLPSVGEPIKLFALRAVAAKIEPNPQYAGALLSATLGTFIATADGSVSEREFQSLLEHAANGLDGFEKERLRANLEWMAAVPPSLTSLRSRLQELDDDQKHMLARHAVAVAGSNGVIDPGEIKAVQKLYKVLGLPDDGIYADLHAVAATGAPSEPITVSVPSAPARSFPIPQPSAATPAPAAGIRLDTAKISSIMADTARVSGVLGAIFTDESDRQTEAEQSGDSDGAALAEASRLAALDAPHRALAEELLSREKWTADQFNQLARQFNLMPDGARENINEWSFAQFDNPFIEEDEDLEINPEVAALLKRELESSAGAAT